MGLPLVGEMLTEDPLLVDRTLEGGSRYQIADKDLDVISQTLPENISPLGGNVFPATIRNLQLLQLRKKSLQVLPIGKNPF